MHFQSSDVKRNYISGLKDTVLLKDIIRRYTIRDVRLLEDLFAYLVNNSSNLLSVTNITNFIKSKGRKTSYDTVSLYLGYIEEVYLAHRALRYNIKGKEILSGSCKYYMNDLSFKNDRIIYVQATYMLVDEQTIEREYASVGMYSG